MMSIPSAVATRPSALRGWLPRFEEDGFALVPGAVSPSTVHALRSALGSADGDGVRRRENVYAIRNLLEAVPAVRELARSPGVRALVEPVLGAGAFAVRGILFDKTPDANWKVAWHQDLTIAVRGRREVEGFGPWSEKAGVVHVQPPAAVLERMVTVRLSLDPCGPENGPVCVIPGSPTAASRPMKCGAAGRARMPCPPAWPPGRAADAAAAAARVVAVHLAGAPARGAPGVRGRRAARRAGVARPVVTAHGASTRMRGPFDGRGSWP